MDIKLGGDEARFEGKSDQSFDFIRSHLRSARLLELE